MSVLGIDIGNDTTKISNLFNGKIETVLNKQSERKTRTILSFKDIRYFGDDAYNQLVNNSKNVCFNFKDEICSIKSNG